MCQQESVSSFHHTGLEMELWSFNLVTVTFTLPGPTLLFESLVMYNSPVQLGCPAVELQGSVHLH